MDKLSIGMASDALVAVKCFGCSIPPEVFGLYLLHSLVAVIASGENKKEGKTEREREKQRGSTGEHTGKTTHEQGLFYQCVGE